MQIREAERSREDGEWYVTDNYFIYSSLSQSLLCSEPLREALIFSPLSTEGFTCLFDTQTWGENTHSKPGFTFLPLLIQNAAKFLGQVEPNRSAGAALGRNVTGRPL